MQAHAPPARAFNILDVMKSNAQTGQPEEQQLAQQQSPTQVPKLKPEDRLKILETEITVCLGKFNDPTLEEELAEIVRERLSTLYNEKGVINTRRKELLDAVYDYTRALEFLKTDTSFVNRALAFVEFGLPKQAWDDAIKAVSFNRKNEMAWTLIKSIEKKYGLEE